MPLELVGFADDGHFVPVFDFGHPRRRNDGGGSGTTSQSPTSSTKINSA